MHGERRGIRACVTSVWLTFSAITRRVIHLSELCRRMETEQETILPFVGSLARARAATGDDNAEGADDETEPSKILERSSMAIEAPPSNQASLWTSTAPTAVPVLIPDRMQNFYRKYNKTLLDCIAMDKEKERLQLENMQLQELIQQYVNGTKV